MTRRTQILADDLCFGEGPRWHEGRLWLSDMHDHKVLAISPDGAKEVMLELEDRPSGLGWLPDGDLLVVAMTSRRLLRVRDGAVSVHADLRELADFHCNDLVVAEDGTAFVGNFGFDLDAMLRGEAEPAATPLIRVAPDGAAARVGEPLKFPNGMAITPDGGTLIVGETQGGRLSAYDLGPGGTLANFRAWAAPPGLRPDGICLDAEGAVWVASPRRGACVRVAEGGAVLDVIPVETEAFACMLGGEDGRTLHILTAHSHDREETRRRRSGRVETVRVDAPRAGRP
ncbi:SMP-30/gluconolactonase/LRE family protein [Albimonas pacifica]|uniref:Gluconolactonase n=1 Tax=Albimonas pacifica TaxID=1114924 RepID=A0A1I3E4D8_9RHOB|nr:SMP-30/gluconolactonase/LRE family protein [Albimonas pacifica]SFH93850.1 gluconolactonase [Albimonas pacifica]